MAEVTDVRLPEIQPCDRESSESSESSSLRGRNENVDFCGVVADRSVPANVRLARRLIYASYFASQFSEWAWQFAVVLFLAAVSNYRSILLVSSYFLTTYGSVMVFGVPIGNFLDRSDRLRAVRRCIVIEHGAVLMATVACCWLLSKTERSHAYSHAQAEGEDAVLPHDKLSIALMVAVHVFGSVAMSFDQGFLVAIERDWIVCLSRQTTDQEAWLSRTNVTLRQIHLACKVASPIFASWIFGDAGAATSSSADASRFCDLHDAAVWVGVLTVASLLIVYLSIARVYSLVPELALPQRSQHTKAPAPASDPVTQESHKEEGEERRHKNKTSLRQSLAIYWEQPIVWAGLSLAFLYANALCFAGAMTTFLISRGMKVKQVGLWSGLSSGVGLTGTFVYDWSARRTTVVNTGAWSVAYLFVCLTLACASFWMPEGEGRAPLYLMVAGTAASRIGLWVFDISVTLLYQEMVPDGVRGLIGGTQQSINSLFVMASGCLGLFFRRPEQFFVIATVGYVCIGIAMILYFFGVYRRGQQFFKPSNQQLPDQLLPDLC